MPSTVRLFAKLSVTAVTQGYFLLAAIATRWPKRVAGPYGIGGMIAFTPFDGQFETVKALAMALYEAGVIAFIAGSNPTRLRFLMPFGAVTTDDIDAVCCVIEKTLDEMSDSSR